jgi:hypothetical protein
MSEKKARVEVPSGSGNFIEVYHTPSGDIVFSLDTQDPWRPQERLRAAITLFGLGKGEVEFPETQVLYAFFAQFIKDYGK